MKKYFYFILVVMVMFGMISCDKDFEPGISRDNHYSMTTKVLQPGETIVVHDSIYVVVYEWIHDTIYVERTDTTTGMTELYKIGSDVVNYGHGFTDDQLSQYFRNETLRLSKPVNRRAEVSNDADTVFVPKVDQITWTTSRPTTETSYDVDGEYDIYTGSHARSNTLNDGMVYKENGSEESASANVDGDMIDMLYRRNIASRLLSVKDTQTKDTLIKGDDIYVKVIREAMFENEYEIRPYTVASETQVITLDTMVVSSATASKDNGIAVVYVNVGKVDHTTDTVPTNPTDTVTPGPTDTVTPGPGPTPDPDGYKINGEKIKSIMYSYVVDPNTKTLKEALLVRTKNYAMPVVDKKKQTAKKVANPKAYNSTAWVNSAWIPATLDLSSNFVWSVDGTVVASATDATIDWLASQSGISSISKSGFLKTATFVNEGNTTRVYVDNKLYMTLK